ncbi:MAG: ribonuclease J [Bradymonadales bacterium]|jgi:ribonuclease J
MEEEKREGREKTEDNALLKITSIGGSGMFGMNCMLLESAKSRILVDCGIMFPADDDWGVDLITPDFSVLETQPLDGIVLTHAHEDHIGAIAFLLKTMQKRGFRGKMPIYGTDITLAFVKRRLTEHELLSSVLFNVINTKEEFNLGDCRVECIDVCHSIPGSVAYAFYTPAGTIVHSGDWRIDNTPMAGAKTNLARLEALGDEGVRVLLADSTNVEVDDAMASELDIYNDLLEVFTKLKGRIFVTLFASNIGRLQSIFTAAAAANRKIAVCGRSLNSNLGIARELNYFSMPNDMEIVAEHKIEEAGENIVVVISGSQGERASSLYKLSQAKHNNIRLRPSDTLIYSARQIPGNEKRVGAIVDGFYRQGASLFNPRDAVFHSSGHGGRKELELLIELLEPEIFVPIHGDYRRLSMHEALADDMQPSPDRSITIEEGYTLKLFSDRHELEQSFIPSRRYVVGKSLDGMDRDCAREKKVLGHNGMLFVGGALNKDEQLRGELRIEEFGISSDKSFLKDMQDELKRTIISSAKHGDMQEIIRHKAAKIIKQKLGKFPHVIVHFEFV